MDLEKVLTVQVGGTGTLGEWMTRRLLDQGSHVIITSRTQKKADEHVQQISTDFAKRVIGVGADPVQAKDRTILIDVALAYAKDHGLTHIVWGYYPALHELEYVSFPTYPTYEQTVNALNDVQPGLVQQMFDVNTHTPLALLREVEHLPFSQSFFVISSHAAKPEMFEKANWIYGKSKADLETRGKSVPNLRFYAPRFPFFEGADNLFRSLKQMGEFAHKEWEDVRLDKDIVGNALIDLVYFNDQRMFRPLLENPDVYELAA